MQYAITVRGNDNESNLNEISNVTATENTNLTEVSDDAGKQQLPMAEMLVRYRRQPPITIVKHVIRPKRVKLKRVKLPKIKYSFAEPPPSYRVVNKPKSSIKHHQQLPMLDSSVFDDFSHMNIESANFDLPPSSYETQSMDLDFYSHGHSYSQSASPSAFLKSPVTHKPHVRYGVPTPALDYGSSAIDGPNSYNTLPISHSDLPSFKNTKGLGHYSGKPLEKTTSYNAGYSNLQGPQAAQPRPPSTKYGVPDVNLPPSGYNKYAAPSDHNPYRPEKQNFGKPSYNTHTDVEISYIPAYEITLPQQAHEQRPSSFGNQLPAQQQYEHPNSYQSPPSPEPPPVYHSPQPHNLSPKYQETPSNDPTPNFHPSQYQESSDSHQPPIYESAPGHRENPGDYIPPLNDLPVANDPQNIYDYPKSSYEVPLYDPIPFDGSDNKEQEVYPPQQRNEYAVKARPPSETPAADTESSGTRKQSTTQTSAPPPPRLRRVRKKKRTKGSTDAVATTSDSSASKHILDVPELEEAFENERLQNHNFNSFDGEVNESHKIENINNTPWNPMKINTQPIFVTTNKPIEELNSNVAGKKNNRYAFRSRSTTSTEEPTKADVVSIQKSQSKSYYDGILEMPKRYSSGARYNLERPKTTNRPKTSYSNGDSFSKRTTKNIFDTTLFKSPVNDRELNYRNLPKNHKLY